MIHSVMKKDTTPKDDGLRPEYDLKNLRVRKMGLGRKSFGDTVRLEADVIEVFPSAEAVNEALRFLIKVTKDSTHTLRSGKDDI